MAVRNPQKRRKIIHYLFDPRTLFQDLKPYWQTFKAMGFEFVEIQKRNNG